MIREQRMMQDMVTLLGDDLDDYISKFNNCDLWNFKENEIIVNKTFKNILNLISNYNLTTADEVLKGAYKLLEATNEDMLSIMSYMGDMCLKNGSDSLLNRAMIFCYALHEICKSEQKSATEILEIVYNYDLAETKTSWLTKLKHKIGYYKRPYKLKINSDGLMLVSILSGKNIEEAFQYILMAYNIE